MHTTKKTRQFNRSLSKKAFLGIVVILLPIIITFFLCYYGNKVYLKKRILDTVTVIAESYEGQVYQFLEMTKQRARDFASDGFIRSQLQKTIHGNTFSVRTLHEHLVKNKLSLDKTLHAITILSLEGRVVASTNNSDLGKDFSNEVFFVKGKDAVTVVENYTGHHRGLPEITISAPIYAKKTDVPVGVIVNYILLSELNNLLSGEYAMERGAISWGKGQGAWKTLEIYLVNRDKFMITKSIFMKDAVLKQKVDTLPVETGLTLNKEIAEFYKDYRGVAVVGASMYIPSMRWVLLVEIDKDEVLAPVKNVLTGVVIMISVVVVMVIFLFIAFLKRVVKPLRTISEAAEDIAVGDFDVTVPVQTHDEIGMLSQSFNYMTQCVRARTAALIKSEARLDEAQQIAHMGNWEWDIITNELYWSDEIYRIFRMSSHEFNATFEAFLQCVHPDDREFVKKSINDALYKSEPYDIEHRILLNGRVRIVHERAVVARDEAGKAVRMAGTVQDITERRYKEEEVDLLQSLILAVGTAKDLHDAMVVTLEKVCSATGWIYGEAWVPNPDGKYLERDHAFYSRVDNLKKFSELSGEYRFSHGVGLPGRVWLAKQPVWVQDVTVDPNYPRAAIAGEVGLKSGIGFPVLTDAEVVAVIVFYLFDDREKDERLIDLVSSAAIQLGQVIKRKQMEELLRKNEHLLQSIFDNTTAVIYVKDIQGRYNFINRQFENLFRIKKDQIKGKTDYDLWPPDIADTFRANDRKIMESKIPMEFEEVVTHHDGPHTYISIKFPLRDSGGSVSAVCGISTDIAERKRLEQAQARLVAILEATPDFVGIANKKGQTIYINRAAREVIGIGKDEDILNTAIPQYHPAWSSHLIMNEGIPTAIRDGVWNGETVLLCRDGREISVSQVIIAHKSPNGEVEFLSTIMRDLTKHKMEEQEKGKLKEQLYHAQRLESVGRLAGGVAHDFNNILTAIIGYGNLVQLEMEEHVSARKYIQKILTSAERAAHLTQSLLAFSRKQRINLKPVDVNEILKNMERLLERLLGEEIRLSISPVNKKCIVMADSSQLEQILMNLATNARDAMPDGGFLTIDIEVVELDADFLKTHGYGTKGNYILISFSDTGVGMNKETREKIFEPFFTTKEVGKGTGLGLAIVYGIIKQHRGYITVFSEKGKGTTFKIYLPLIESAIEKPKPEIIAKIAGGTETILVAEDEAEVRNLIKTVLEGFGYTIIDAVDGVDGIQKFIENKDKIQLLIFDVIMPKKGGKEAYDIIQKIKPDIKILFMSGYSEDVVSKKILLDERLNFIAKPISPSDFSRKVRDVLDKPSV